MKTSVISLRRRQFMAAGLAAAAAPAALFAGPASAAHHNEIASAIALGGAGKMIVSGRVLDADRRPLAGARVEMWRPEAQTERTGVATDADGRFFVIITPAGSGRPQLVHYRVSHRGRVVTENSLHFEREPGVPDDRIAQLQRDDSGAWRATFGLTLA